MGVDLHMFIVEDKKVIMDVATDLFDNFRDYKWFNNISENGESEAYEHFPLSLGISDQAPDEIVNDSNDFGCYNRYSINVQDFINWFLKYRPDVDAGWVTTYEKWQYEKYNKIPEEIQHCLPSNANMNDVHFIEIINSYEPAAELYEYFKYNDVSRDADIVYWFDC